ncbi:hypothetical protein CPT_Silence21 [Bacillus phage Silence]|nr:hypothetical protein CPT_Silence21 [Bacillus phage Silence]
MEHELQDIFKMYIEVDEQGNITDSLGGANVVPLKDYTFFFLDTAVVEGEEMILPLVMENVFKLKLVINGFKPEFVLKDSNDELTLEMPGIAVFNDDPTTGEETV